MNDLSNSQYSGRKNIRLKTSVLRSDLCDYSDTYIFPKKKIDVLVVDANENDKAHKDVPFKPNSPFKSCISNFNNVLTENPDNPNIIMPMYNLLFMTNDQSKVLIIMLQMANHSIVR